MKFIRWWEELITWKQVLIAGPSMILLLFWLNFGLMMQPFGRSAGYGLLEGTLFAALLIVATRHEHSKRHDNSRRG
ncbi:MAG: hypothetical protein ACREN8_01875 [Candidatus Dormibacteraceae bacterium]